MIVISNEAAVGKGLLDAASPSGNHKANAKSAPREWHGDHWRILLHASAWRKVHLPQAPPWIAL